jgi:DNA invertase Pin-like site-specific DNA recombinase
MTNFAYLRISTDGQDARNQKFGILDYCNKHNLSLVEFVEDNASGQIPWQDRAIGQIIHQASKGDNIIVSEISRLGRSTLQVLEILTIATQKEVPIHIVKNHMIIDGSINSTISATILGLTAQIEREFISTRTKEALARRKSQGLKLGRPKGQADLLKLDSYHEEITNYLKKGINKRAISKLIDCSPSTLYLWLKRRKLYDKK